MLEARLECEKKTAEPELHEHRVGTVDSDRQPLKHHPHHYYYHYYKSLLF